MPRTPLFVAAAVVLALLTGACSGTKSASTGSSTTTSAAVVGPNATEVSPSGDIPDNQVFVAYTPPVGGYTVKVPEGWARTEAQGAVTFTDKLNSITMQAIPARTPPTTGDAQRTELPKLARTVRGFEPGKVTAVTRRAGRAVRITYLADARPDPVTGKVGKDAVERYGFFHKGEDIVLTLKGPKGADNVDPWKIVTDSLRYTR